MLFKDYDTITYKIGNRSVTLVDIFRNITFTNIETSKAFDDYYIQDGETPEIVAERLYGTTSLSWLVMLVNNFNHIKNDWFVSAEEYQKTQDRLYGGDAIYIPALPDIKVGDILVKVTGTASNGATAVNKQIYRHIADFDPYFRKIRGICGSGGLTAGDLILFARQNPENGTVTPIYFTDQSGNSTTTNYTNITLIEPYGKSVLYFYNSYNVIIDPYRIGASGSTSINSFTTYLNTSDTTTENNFAYSLLYKYGLCGGTAPSNLYKKTVTENEYAKYIKKQRIKILRSEYVNTVVLAVENALQSDTIGKKIKIEL
jgi:hypothetical protein